MKTLFLSALVLGFAAVSYAGNPKGETKESTESPAKIESKATLTTYYAVRNAIGSPQPFHWTDDFSEISENELDCAPLAGASCEVLAESKPADGSMPPGQTATGEAYQ
ncbi:hypothetical protein LL912_12620 [Niabella sp. CC-SYL272]|uniref:hypothetical protein n=1 Tax=Niabella agricola TaxID=2891571 RepID=UPI001F29A641|nr:hypothetical protein [Niabella agricola]MCF3109616.1 hypothetical protein [Niabella agricola]